MKKVLIIMTLALVSFANAQKGSILVAGDLGYATRKQGVDNQSQLSFNPKVGYQFSDNMTVGIDAGIGSYKQPIGGGYDRTDNSTKLGAFLRYGKSLGGVFSIYADLGAGIQNSKSSNTNPASTEQKANGFYVGITPAVAIDLKKSFCLNFSIGGLNYDSIKGTAPGSEASNTFRLTFGGYPTIGISKNF